MQKLHYRHKVFLIVGLVVLGVSLWFIEPASRGLKLMINAERFDVNKLIGENGSQNVKSAFGEVFPPGTDKKYLLRVLANQDVPYILKTLPESNPDIKGSRVSFELVEKPLFDGTDYFLFFFNEENKLMRSLKFEVDQQRLDVPLVNDRWQPLSPPPVE